MSKSVMISLLDQGNTGSEILSILDTLTADKITLIDGHHRTAVMTNDLNNSIPTLEEIAF